MGGSRRFTYFTLMKLNEKGIYKYSDILKGEGFFGINSRNGFIKYNNKTYYVVFNCNFNRALMVLTSMALTMVK